MKKLFLSVFLLLNFPGCSTQCTSTEQPDANAGLCYLFHRPALSFSDANLFCQTYGYELASIHSILQNSLIQTASTQYFQSKSTYWVGGTNEFTNSSWRWTDRTSWNYSRCCADEPTPTEHCVSVSVGNGRWNSAQCNKKNPFVCARRMQETSTTPTSTVSTTTSTTRSPGVPVNCVFVGDYSSFGTTADGYSKEQAFIKTVGNTLYDNSSLSFGASMTYFGYVPSQPDGTTMNEMLDKATFDLDVSSADVVPFASQLTVVIDELNDNFSWSDSQKNTCLVVFSATADTDDPFTSADQFDLIIGAAIGGATTSAFSSTPLIISEDYSQYDVNNVVFAIINKFI